MKREDTTINLRQMNSLCDLQAYLHGLRGQRLFFQNFHFRGMIWMTGSGITKWTKRYGERYRRSFQLGAFPLHQVGPALEQ